MMNNMLVEREIVYLKNENINSLSDNKDYIINPQMITSEKLLIDVPDNYNLRFFLKSPLSGKYDISFIQHNNSNIEFYFSIKSNDDLNINVYNIVSGDDNKTLIKGRIFNNEDDTNSFALVSGDINKGTKGNVYTEDVRGIKLKTNNLQIEPDLLVSTSEVEANHMVSIGTFDEEMVLYLKEKGIKYSVVKDLLTKSFLNSIFPDNTNEVLDEII